VRGGLLTLAKIAPALKNNVVDENDNGRVVVKHWTATHAGFPAADMAHISLVATLKAKHVGSTRASVPTEAVRWPHPQSLVGFDMARMGGYNNGHGCRNNGRAFSDFSFWMQREVEEAVTV